MNNKKKEIKTKILELKMLKRTYDVNKLDKIKYIKEILV